MFVRGISLVNTAVSILRLSFTIVWVSWLGCDVKRVSHIYWSLMALNSNCFELVSACRWLPERGCILVCVRWDLKEINLGFRSLEWCNAFLYNFCFLFILFFLFPFCFRSILLLLFFHLLVFFWNNLSFIELVLILKSVTPVPYMFLEFKDVKWAWKVCQELNGIEIGWLLTKSYYDFTNNWVVVDDIDNDVGDKITHVILHSDHLECIDFQDVFVSFVNVTLLKNNNCASYHVKYSQRTIFFKFILLDFESNSR